MVDRDGLGLLRGLPDEIVNYILRHLSTEAITCLSCTSKAWNVLCGQETVWKKRWLSYHCHEASFQVSVNSHLLMRGPELPKQKSGNLAYRSDELSKAQFAGQLEGAGSAARGCS